MKKTKIKTCKYFVGQQSLEKGDLQQIGSEGIYKCVYSMQTE